MDVTADLYQSSEIAKHHNTHGSDGEDDRSKSLDICNVDNKESREPKFQNQFKTDSLIESKTKSQLGTVLSTDSKSSYQPFKITEHNDADEDQDDGPDESTENDVDSVDGNGSACKEQNDNIGSTSQTSSSTAALSGDQMWAVAIRFKLRVIEFVHKHGVEAAALCCQLDEKVIKDWMGSECVLRKMESTIGPSTGEQYTTGKTHSSYTIEFKLKVVNFAKKYNIAQTANHFRVARKQISDWIKNESKLIAQYRNRVKQVDSPAQSSDKMESNDVSSSSPVLSFTHENQVESEEIRRMLEKSKCGSSHKGKKIKSYDVDFKLLVVEFAKEHSNNETARHFQIDKKQVREWKKHEGRLRSMEKAGLNILRGRGRKLRYPVVDTLLMSWLVEQEAKGIFVSEKAIKLKATELHVDKGDPDFKASSGWIRSFCKRNNVQMPKSGRGPGRPCKNSQLYSHEMEDLPDHQYEDLSDTVDIYFDNEGATVEDAKSNMVTDSGIAGNIMMSRDKIKPQVE